MPEVKNYDGKKKSTGPTTEKRRPHREASTENATEQSADILEATSEFNTEALNEGVSAEELADRDMISEGAPAEEIHKKTHLEFYGSDLIREKVPKVMELADTVADEWIQDGRFEGLPVGHPLAQIAAAKVLRKAKDVEKKLEEKGVFALAKMGADYIKAEVEKRKKH